MTVLCLCISTKQWATYDYVKWKQLSSYPFVIIMKHQKRLPKTTTRKLGTTWYSCDDGLFKPVPSYIVCCHHFFNLCFLSIKDPCDTVWPSLMFSTVILGFFDDYVPEIGFAGNDWSEWVSHDSKIMIGNKYLQFDLWLSSILSRLYCHTPE